MEPLNRVPHAAPLNKSRQKCRHRGVVLVEIAIVLPLLLLLTCGILQYAWLFVKTQQIHNAARDGARMLALVDGTKEGVETRINALMAAGQITGFTVTCSPSSPEPGNPVTVKLTVPVTTGNKLDLLGVTKIGDWNFALPSNLTATVSMMREST